MGIIANAAYLMMLEGAKKPFSGSVLQLGRQVIHLTHEQLVHLSNIANFKLTPIEVIAASTNLSDIDFFTALGFTKVSSLEFSTSENADYVHDLNNPVPENLHCQFDLIYDGGTLEHVFNIPCALDSICKMLTLSGRILHDSPTSGYIDHGFFSLQPTLFHDFYLSQSFSINTLIVSRLNKDQLFTHTAEQFPYIPGAYDYAKTWAVDGMVYMTFCIATKDKAYESIQTPQQSLWMRARQ
jgi:hypothetical protein